MSSRFGFWAAWAAAIAAIAYDIPQLLQVFGAIREPLDRILIFAPSLALAPSFVLAVVAVHASTSADRRVWSLGALAIALLYAADVSQVYIIQLGAVIPRDIAGDHSLASAACCGPQLPMTSLDLLGYTYMSLSTLLLVPVFGNVASMRALRLALALNGCLAPVIFGQLLLPSLIYVAAAWLVTFPACMILLAQSFFARSEK
ncbi:MAG TPA: hypothetical protein VHE37_06785 [Nevskiaceae bacterium]|nr:hypothetical protein [Nevskiaceae bacterium]